jgi:hypothetical protein
MSYQHFALIDGHMVSQTARERVLVMLREMPLISPFWILRAEREALDQLVFEGLAAKRDGCWLKAERTQNDFI